VCLFDLHSSQDHLRTGTGNLDHPISCRCKKYRQLARQVWGFVACFPQAILIVPSSSITIAADGDCLGNFEFIADYFRGLSLSPRRSDEGKISLGSTHSGASTPQRGHDRGLCRGVPHDIKWGRRRRPPFS
jgi:hypothetical protein